MSTLEVQYTAGHTFDACFQNIIQRLHRYLVSGDQQSTVNSLARVTVGDRMSPCRYEMAVAFYHHSDAAARLQ